MSLVCYHCKKEVLNTATSGPLRIGMRDSCDSCHADLHVCLNCEFYDPSSHHECRETQAEFVPKKDKGNRCDYFRPSSRSDGTGSKGSSAAQTLAALDDLFKK